MAARRPAIGVTAICASVGVLTACTSVPEFDQGGDQPSGAGSRPQIIGAYGPLTARQSKALLERMSTEPGDAGVLKRHLAIEQAVAEDPLIAGNHTRILRDGPEAFHAIFAAIQDAKDHVNLEYFILEDVESDGLHLGDLLVAKRQAGVAVNLIYDSYGSSSTPASFFDRLKQAGVTVVEYNPINPLDAKVSYSLNDRDHRKILVVDGATAIIGGVNLSTTYQSNPLGKSGAPKGESTEHWRDTDLQLDGPVVAQLQTLFLDHWTKQDGPPLAVAKYFPAVPAKGTEVVRILGSTPDRAIPRYYVTVLSAIRNAEKSISVSAAYFVPTHQEMEDLTDAARRGIDVTLLLPDQSDSARAIAVAHSHYSDLLAAGVKIYETHDLVLHSKSVVVDGVWSVIGSSNFDQRSVLFNDEVDAVVLGSETAQAMETMFGGDVAGARQIDIATWDERPLSQRMREFFSRIWQTLL
jgi:cardiolipin synthase